MKLLVKALVWASVAALASSLAVAASPIVTPAQHLTGSPLLGNWLLDTSRMPIPPEQRPQSVRFAFADAGNNTLAMHVDIVYAPGNEVHSASTAPLDGTPAPVKNSPEGDAASFKSPAPNVLVMALQRGSVLVSTRIYAVEPDGQHLVETAVYPGKDGSIVMRTNYFTRAR
ncbi:hypothetical protein [Dyella acidiphila]|uniref:LuxR family transcriptional regulator n=1 Tax=Dyella acidiphila TaxID=2775866 RepID=A0ABR9G9T8_9GAMM|nr:hypothetical protein [Dyella acidiphila]MBE1160807.1 hypothetical protein [Dyella acidiphila]